MYYRLECDKASKDPMEIEDYQGKCNPPSEIHVLRFCSRILENCLLDYAVKQNYMPCFNKYSCFTKAINLNQAPNIVNHSFAAFHVTHIMLRYVVHLSNNKYAEIKITQIHQIMILIKTQQISVFQFNYDTEFSVIVYMCRRQELTHPPSIDTV